MPHGPCGLFPGDGHVLYEDRAARAALLTSTSLPTATMPLNMSRRFPAIGDLLDRKLDLAAVDPVACGTARVVAGDEIDALPEQFGD